PANGVPLIASGAVQWPAIPDLKLHTSESTWSCCSCGAPCFALLLWAATSSFYFLKRPCRGRLCNCLRANRVFRMALVGTEVTEPAQLPVVRASPGQMFRRPEAL